VFVLFLVCSYMCVCVVFKSKVHCWSASIRSGFCRLPSYFAPLVCISDVIRGLAVCQWRHNKPKTKNPSFARRPTFCNIQDNLKMSFIYISGDLRIMSHVGHLRGAPEFVRGKWIEKENNLVIIIL